MKTLRITAAALLTLTIAACQGDSDSIMEARIDELYDRMPQQERLAQLRSMYMNELFDDSGNLDSARCAELIPFGIGHFSQYASQQPLDPAVHRDRVAAVQKWLMENTPNGIPALFHEEVLSGVNAAGATIYPQQIGQACSFDTDLAELKTRQTGTALRKIGGLLSLSPMVDVCRNPSFNRLEESYGEDAYLSAAFGCAFVRGLQQGDLRKGVGACSKHFLGYGGGGDAREKELMEEILLPHETMIRTEGSKVVMTGYHSIHGTDCVASKEIIRGILRDYLGFDGMMVSDYGSINQIQNPGTPVARAAAAMNAGNEVDFPRGETYASIPEALKRNMISEETFEQAVKSVLRYKYRAGMFDADPYLYDTGKIIFDTPEERRTAYDIASESIVLLENDGVLPLKEGSRIFLTGPNANSMWAMCGDYSYPAMAYFWRGERQDGENPHVVRLLEAMEARKPSDSSVSYSRGCDWTEDIETLYSQAGDERAWQYWLLHRKVDSGESADWNAALSLAMQSDVIVAAMGENVMLCGENRDRIGLRLPGLQEQFVEELIATGKPVVLVMFGGRAQVVSGLAERCAAVIQAWYPGEEGGNAVADILYGKVSPSAKLCLSYPNTEVDEAFCYTYSGKTDPRVQWPFGYGLSYTTFEYSGLETALSAPADGGTLKISFTIKNIGDIAADEIAQIYISPAEGQNIRPLSLKGFERVSLKPGQSRKVTVVLHADQFGYYSREDGQKGWNVAPGAYTLKVGASSADIRLQTAVTLTGSPVRKPLRDRYFSDVQ